MERRVVLGVPVYALDIQSATARLLSWARSGGSRYACLANVHMLMEAHDCPQFNRLLHEADLVLPDGAPVAWMLRRLGVTGQEQVRGPDLMLTLCQGASEQGLTVGLLGAGSPVAESLQDRLLQRYPGLQIGYRYSPPFTEISDAAIGEIGQDIAARGVKLLFVALGCPQQEYWMAVLKDRLPAVMVGVGAAFDIHAGHLPEAPRWMRRHGLEWVHRLRLEPRRLWKRYLWHNSRFIGLAARELARPRPLPP